MVLVFCSVFIDVHWCWSALSCCSVLLADYPGTEYWKPIWDDSSQIGFQYSVISKTTCLTSCILNIQLSTWVQSPWTLRQLAPWTGLGLYTSYLINWEGCIPLIRRLRADLILCYKIIRGWFLLSPDSFFTFICNSRTLGHSFKLFLPHSRVNCRQHFFAVRVLRIGNSLPEDVLSAAHLSLFISRLVRVNLKSVSGRQDVDAFMCSVLYIWICITNCIFVFSNFLSGCV